MAILQAGEFTESPKATGLIIPKGEFFSNPPINTDAPISQRASNVGDLMLESAVSAAKVAPKLLPAAGMVAASMAAAPFVAGMALPTAAALGIGAAAAGAGVGKIAEQKVTGQDINMAEVGKSAGEAALWESGFRALGMAAKPIASYVANSPRILNAIARITSSLTNKGVSTSSILEGMQRPGLGGKMGKIEETTKNIKYGKPSVRNLAMDEVTVAKKEGAAVLGNVQKTLRDIREEVGKEIDAVDEALDMAAFKKGDNYIDISPVTKNIADDLSFIQANPLLKDAISTTKLENIVQNVAKQPDMTIADAIKTKKTIQKVFEDFSNVWVMKVKDMDILEQSMKDTRQILDGIIKKKAVDLGMPEYADTYEKFGKYAYDYDETLMPLFGSKEGQMATTSRLELLQAETINLVGIQEIF